MCLDLREFMRKDRNEGRIGVTFAEAWGFSGLTRKVREIVHLSDATDLAVPASNTPIVGRFEPGSWSLPAQCRLYQHAGASYGELYQAPILCEMLAG